MKPQYLLMVLSACLVQAAVAADPASTQPANKESPLSNLEFVSRPQPLDLRMPNMPPDAHFIVQIDGLKAPGLVMFKDRLPQDMGKYIPSDETRKAIQQNHLLVMPQQWTSTPLATEYRLMVLASSPEQGEKLMRAFLEGYQSWWRENARQFVEKSLEDARKNLESAKADLATFNNLWPVPQGTINDLVTKELMIDVDISGVRAKIQAAREQAQGKVGSRMEQIDQITTTAQIDLARLLEEKARIASILKAHERLEHIPGSDKSSAEGIMNGVQSSVKDWEDTLATLPADPMTLIALHDNKVEVRPLMGHRPG